MSGGYPCTCPDRKKAMREDWYVTQRFCNHSAFSGYHYTPSNWSAIVCRVCNHSWRTKAAYVHTLPDSRPPVRRKATQT